MISKPALRYPGGKWKISDWVISHFPKHSVYSEPLGGGGSVLIKKKPVRVEIYNDINSEMVNFFRVLRNVEKSKRLVELLHLTPYARDEFLSCYERSLDDVEQARRTFVLSFMCYHPGSFLTRKKDGFKNNSTGYYQGPKTFIRYTENLIKIAERLKNVIIENRDWEEVAKQHQGYDTLTYLDPPYLMESRGSNDKLYSHEMSENDHMNLIQVAKSLKGYVAISGYPSQLYFDQLENDGWEKITKNSTVASPIAGRTKRVEALWLNPKAIEKRRQLKLF